MTAKPPEETAGEPEFSSGPSDAPVRPVGAGFLSLSVLLGIASFVNYASNLAFARALTPASYGDLTALLALSVVIAVPFAAAQTRIAERVARNVAQDRWDQVQYTVRHALAHLFSVALVCTLLYCATVPLVVEVLDLQAIGPALALAALIFVGFFLPVLQGALQGMERWLAFGLAAIAIAVSRLAFGVPWAQAGGGAGGAIAGQAVGVAVCIGYLGWILRHQIRRTGNAAAWAGVRRRPDIQGVAAGAAFVCFAMIANLDVVLAKIFLQPYEAGQYAALATIGKIVTFLPTAVAVIVVPDTARAGAEEKQRTAVLRRAALAVGGTALIAALPAAIAPTFVVRTMFGSEYLDGTSGVLPIVCAGWGLSMLYLIVTFAVTIQDHRWTWLLLSGVAVQIVGVACFHGSVTQVAGVQAFSVAYVLVFNEIRYHSLLPRIRRARTGTA